MTIEQLRLLKESENKVEFKSARHNYNYAGGDHKEPRERRKCVLGYITALCNEGGGMLVLGMGDAYPHEVTGSDFAQGNEGKLTDKIFQDIGIRVNTEVLTEQGKRVLVINIPRRPVGKIFKFEGIALMRTGESLRDMSDAETLRILTEQEPDYSAKICEGITTADLDEEAILRMKIAYSEKQKNPQFLTLNNEQVLNDLELTKDNKLTNACLILLGKKEVIKRILPQAGIFLEYRSSESLIRFDKRDFFQDPYFILIDTLWNSINMRNGYIPVQQGPYIFDISYFNKEVIREAVNNAVAHRDYNRTSEIVIKQYPNSLTIINPGGFPPGVTIENIINVSSTPRNRLLAEVLAKTGIVERSGQGVDKIYYQCLSEAKGAPDYSSSDNFQVDLKLSGMVKDKAFALFINQVQKERTEEEKLGVFEVITLDKIRQGCKREELDSKITAKLIEEGLIEKRGQTKGIRYILSKEYYEFTDQRGKYTRDSEFNQTQAMIIMADHLKTFPLAQMKDFIQLFDSRFSRRQVKYLVNKLVGEGILEMQGQGKGTVYKAGARFIDGMKFLEIAMEVGVNRNRPQKD